MVTLTQERPAQRQRHASLDTLLARVEAGDEIAETEFSDHVRKERMRLVDGLETWLIEMGRRAHDARIPPRLGGDGIHALAATLKCRPSALKRLAPLLDQLRRDTQRDKHLDALTRAVRHW